MFGKFLKLCDVSGGVDFALDGLGFKLLRKAGLHEIESLWGNLKKPSWRPRVAVGWLARQNVTILLHLP